MNKKNKIVICLLTSVICMTACGNSIPDMTREQEDLVTQYAAGALLERLNDSGTRLVDTSEPKEEPTLADAVTVTPMKHRNRLWKTKRLHRFPQHSYCR